MATTFSIAPLVPSLSRPWSPRKPLSCLWRRLMYQSIPSAIIPPRATPGHLTPVQLHIVGHLTRIEARPIGHLTPRKNAGHRSRVKRILYSMSQVITPRGFRQNCWFASDVTAAMLVVKNKRISLPSCFDANFAKKFLLY